MSNNTPIQPKTPPRSDDPKTPYTHKTVQQTQHSLSSLMTRKSMRLTDDYIVKNFQPNTTYRFGQVNLISIKKGHVYDLLEKGTPTKTVNCNCLKTHCNVNYCQCFRNGQVCNQECYCKNCQNKHQHPIQIAPKKITELRCNCVKSNCLKKYCQCLQKGQRCGEKCGCIDCKNQHRIDFP